ncbi:hemolysin secretion/activation ShlB/FhaC/HecB family protein [Methyloversatilis sp. RAC08]|uniref:ShlB/FhaC/HecB family hemolysin secretion/activation protein n=1 Tax=Methyloversatilis sp. RAC08 TaxID=1842540 RepID=UPI00083DDB61|nr:ShlB/FhaC/HecB family hemolysin secretion/activation protein [Methyloversatilis sp. RAC08]AOF80506.1 hemolysin secretion/activation ShlB/FhaC/HecB family protein [Methyloversatilis sp. RAC08]
MHAFCRLCAVVLSVCPPFGLAASPEPSDRLIDERRASERDSRWQRATTPLPAQPQPALHSRPADIDEAGVTTRFRDIRVDAAGLLDDASVTALVAPFLAVPLGRQRIELLLRQLDAQLVEAGWITSRARLLALDAQTGELAIELVPGRIESLRAPGIDAAAMARAFPFAVGEALSLSALEQGVQQINRLRMYQAQVRVLPGNAAGTSLLDIVLNEGRAWSMAFGLDNQGSSTTGGERLRVTARAGNLLGWLDDLQFALLHSTGSDALLASLSIPGGYNLWSVTVSGSRASFDIAGLEVTSRSASAVLGWSRVLSSSAGGRSVVDVSLIRSRLARDIESAALQTEHSTVGRAAWMHILRGERWQVFIEPSLSAGLSLLGATRDRPDLSRGDTHRQFMKWAIAAGAVVRNASDDLEYAVQLTAQRAGESLIGAEQLHLGGFASVRGFREVSVSGDTGHVLRTELRLPQAFRPAGHPVVPFLHVDHGAARLSEGPRNTLASAGVGARGAGQGVLWEGVVSVPIARDADPPSHGWRAHLSVSFEI